MSAVTLCVPEEPFFVELLHHWQKNPQAKAVRDSSQTPQETDISEFLYDVLTVRERIWETLDDDIRKNLESPDTDVFIALLTNEDYSFIVLLFALYGLGAAIAPVSPGILLEEASYIFKNCSAVLLASGSVLLSQAQAISEFTGVPLLEADFSHPQRPTNLSFELDAKGPQINPKKSFAVFQTSGTTGKPKGVLYSREAAVIGLRSQIESFGLSSTDVWLQTSPLHWGAGFTLSIITIVSGACMEFRGPGFGPRWLVDRLGAGGITFVYIPPFLLDEIADMLAGTRSTCSDLQSQAALRGIRELRVLCTGAMRVQSSTLSVWKGLRGGKPPMVVYAMSESISLVATTDWKSDIIPPQGCCGRPSSHVEIKISDAGEICIRSKSLFKKYISDNPNATKDVYDSEGFYRTGDTGRLEDGNIFVSGRASQDMIRFSMWHVPACKVEDALSSHPDVSQAIVLGISSEREDQRVGALLITKRESAQNFTLAQLRRWLAVDNKMPAYMLPTVLRVLEPHQAHQIPVTVSGKPIKSKIRHDLFSQEALSNGIVEMCDPLDDPEIVSRPFDWAGRQAQGVSVLGT
ncbi:hypothetical protein BJX96DRAFT_173756 [Aspergillus floccosus]